MRLFLIFSCFLCYNATFGQDKCNYANFIVTVDGQVVTSSRIKDSYIVIVDTLKDVKEVKIDTLYFKYNTGVIVFDDYNYRRFLDLDKSNIVTVKFTYISDIDANRRYFYKFDIALKYLNYEFFILKIYNFENKKNWKDFDQRVGYGVEWQASERLKVIPRRQKGKP